MCSNHREHYETPCIEITLTCFGVNTDGALTPKRQSNFNINLTLLNCVLFWYYNKKH